MGNKTRAKFICNEVTKRVGWDKLPFLYAAQFTPVFGDNPENKEFFAATPCGTIMLSTVKADHFEVGKTYYVDFTPAD